MRVGMPEDELSVTIITSLTDSGGNDSKFPSHLCLVDTVQCVSLHPIRAGSGG